MIAGSNRVGKASVTRVLARPGILAICSKIEHELVQETQNLTSNGPKTHHSCRLGRRRESASLHFRAIITH